MMREFEILFWVALFNETNVYYIEEQSTDYNHKNNIINFLFITAFHVKKELSDFRI